MKYAKPTINVVVDANSAIESHNKATFQGSDSIVSPYQTLGAYEADE